MAAECFKDEYAWILHMLSSIPSDEREPARENSYYGFLHAIWVRVFQKNMGFMPKPQCRLGNFSTDATGKPDSRGSLITESDRYAKYPDSEVVWISPGNFVQYSTLVSEAKKRSATATRRFHNSCMTQLIRYLRMVNDGRVGKDADDKSKDPYSMLRGDIHGVLTCGNVAYRVETTHTADGELCFDQLDSQMRPQELCDPTGPLYHWLVGIRDRFTAQNGDLQNRWPEWRDGLLAKNPRSDYHNEASIAGLVAATFEDYYPLRLGYLIKPQAVILKLPSARDRKKGLAARDSSGVMAGRDILRQIDMSVNKVVEGRMAHPILFPMEFKKSKLHNNLFDAVNEQLDKAMLALATRAGGSPRYVYGVAVMGNCVYIKGWMKTQKGVVKPRKIGPSQTCYRMDRVPQDVRDRLIEPIPPAMITTEG